MFKKDQMMFISDEDFKTDYHDMEDISQQLDDNAVIYSLSFHNGFKKFDYAKINSYEKRLAEIDAIRLTFENPNGRTYVIDVDKTQKLYTLFRGYVPAMKLSNLDVFYDQFGMYCKLLKKENIGITKEEVYELDVAYNKSAFINGILMRTCE